MFLTYDDLIYDLFNPADMQYTLETILQILDFDHSWLVIDMQPKPLF
jgi:hypothetical protein